MFKTGDSIRLIREGKSLTRKEVQDITKISQQYIGEMERGEANPTLDVLWRLSSAYGVSIGELIGDPGISSTKLAHAIKKLNLSKEETELIIKLIQEFKKNAHG
jgi:transcriptional regulator with XRE-family HTH domain